MQPLNYRGFRKDYSGQRFHNLVALKYVGHIGKKDPVWECQCDCGRIKNIRLRCLKGGHNKTCGECPNDHGNKHYAWKGCGELPKDHFNAIWHSAKDRGLEFDVTMEYVWRVFEDQKGLCALTGRPIIFNSTYRNKAERTASLDRIDSTKGYIEGNLQWVHKIVNKLKKNLPDEDFINLCIEVAATRYNTKKIFNSDEPIEEYITSVKTFLSNGKKIVFTNGCFDIIHAGHVWFLEQCKILGDFLIVGLNSDESIKGLKGDSRPINTFNDRAVVLKGMQMVDCVMGFNDATPLSLIKKIQPRILVKGADWNNNVVGKDFVESHGGIVYTIPLVEGLSTSRIIDKVKSKETG
jgi:D-glycero-beta-D-manno-heptose 1-phosphate adenylyltransferase